MEEHLKILVDKVITSFDTKEWIKIFCVFEISRTVANKNKAGMIKTSLFALNKGTEKIMGDKRILLKTKYLQDLIRLQYEELLDHNINRFNNLELKIFPNKTYKINYIWDEDKEYQDKINAAKIFYHWVNELMIHRIFDYEKENNLLKTRYDDDDGDMEFLSSWDKGIFTFQFLNGVLIYEIELYKERQSRILEMPLHQSYQEALWNHYKVTNEELKEWKPWNTLVIKSPNGEIPFGKENDFVIYSLNTIDQTNLS